MDKLGLPEEVNLNKAEATFGVAPEVPISYWPAHHRFSDLISFSVCGTSHPHLKTGHTDDHIARVCELLLDDIEGHLWEYRAGKRGLTAYEMLSDLQSRIQDQKDEHAAKVMWSLAAQASFEVLRLYLRDRELFDRIAPRRKFLPAFFSIHPETAPLMAQMRTDSHLGTATNHAGQVESKSFFMSDRPANVYARAIITSISMNAELQCRECQQAGWADFDREEGVKTEVLPLPKYIQGMAAIPNPITPESVMQYWRKGKEIILEDMPDFHNRPEWRDYHERQYKTGSKSGAIQHAIFKDILAALKSIAGSRKHKSPKKSAAKS